VTAPEVLHRVVTVHKGSDLALKWDNAGWLKIHRVRSVTRLSVRETSFTLACGLRVESHLEATPLSSGHLGSLCKSCWPFLIHDEAA
jgi:hypothetical protein